MEELIKVPIAREDLPPFEEVWETYIMPLQGQEITLGNGKDINKIEEVNEWGLKRRSKNDILSDLIPIKLFENTYMGLIESPNGEISRKKDILNKYAKKRCASIILAVFAQTVPFIKKIGKAEGLQLLLK